MQNCGRVDQKKLNIQFFKDIQARMRDPNFKFSPDLKLKPKSKLVSRKKWQKARARKRKNDRRWGEIIVMYLSSRFLSSL
jgi:hypothetical protein